MTLARFTEHVVPMDGGCTRERGHRILFYGEEILPTDEWWVPSRRRWESLTLRIRGRAGQGAVEFFTIRRKL